MRGVGGSRFGGSGGGGGGGWRSPRSPARQEGEELAQRLLGTRGVLVCRVWEGAMRYSLVRQFARWARVARVVALSSEAALRRRDALETSALDHEKEVRALQRAHEARLLAVGSEAEARVASLELRAHTDAAAAASKLEALEERLRAEAAARLSLIHI